MVGLCRLCIGTTLMPRTGPYQLSAFYADWLMSRPMLRDCS
jgi:hypothetical protein